MDKKHKQLYVLPNPETIISGRRLNRFNSQAFNKDITRRVTPTKIETLKASTFF